MFDRIRRAASRTSSLTVLAIVLPAMAWAQDTIFQFNIPAEDLGTALRAYARVTGDQVAFDSAATNAKESAALVGNFGADQGLKVLLSRSDLMVERSPSGVLMVRPKNVQAASNNGAAGVAFAGETVVVTAEKKTENIQDTPVPVSVVDPSRLSQNGYVRIQDYASIIPGFNDAPSYQGYQFLTIRGVSTGGTQNPTVGVVVDDVPFGASVSAGGNGIPDIDPGDLDRIEVLKGPQGTLYGANSMGGLFKIVTKDPSPDGYTARLEIGSDSIYNGAEPGFSIRGAANIPLTDDFAIRVSGFKRQGAGYIDYVNLNNPALNLAGINQDNSDGARISAKWIVSDNFTLKFSALYQHNRANGSGQETALPGLGAYQQSFLPGVGRPTDRQVQAYSLLADYKLGSFDITSLTGFNVNRYRDSLDLSYAVSAALIKTFNVGGDALVDAFRNEKFSQELRASTTVWDDIDILLGGFYTHEIQPFTQTQLAQDTTTGRVAGVWSNSTFPTQYWEEAVFGNVTYRITDKLDVQLGGRYTQNRNSANVNITTGPAAGPTGMSSALAESSKGSVLTYLFTPRYRLDDDVMIYARLASGYRPGGPNSSLSISFGAPAFFSPDKTYSYEIGSKGQLLGNFASFDVSAYHIDWQNIQIKLVGTNGAGYAGNGGNAKSEGVEASFILRPWAGFTLTPWINYDDTEIVAVPAHPAAVINVGDPLAYSSKWSGHVAAEQQFPLNWNGVVATLGADVGLLGNRHGPFSNSPGAARQVYPAYSKYDFHAGLAWQSWSLNAYVDNVGNVHGLENGGTGFAPPYAFIYTQPRTVGFNLTKEF